MQRRALGESEYPSYKQFLLLGLPVGLETLGKQRQKDLVMAMSKEQEACPHNWYWIPVIYPTNVLLQSKLCLICRYEEKVAVCATDCPCDECKMEHCNCLCH
jgi:hypothetical protein